MKIETLPQLLVNRVAASGSAEAFLSPTPSGSWKSWTWNDVGQLTAAISLGLRSLGLKSEERCALLSGTRVEWIFADFGIMCAGGATTTIYPSNTADEYAYILKDSDARYVFAENEDHLNKLKSKRAELPEVRKVFTFDGQASSDGWVMRFDELIELGKKALAQDAGALARMAGEIRLEALATLIYTSGTTGRPKGVELTHDCWAYEAEAIDRLRLLTSSDRQYLWLPLSHVFGKVLIAAQVRIGFPTAVDGRVEKLVENLAVIRPTVVCAVPRIFEKVHNKVVAASKEGGPVKEAIFKWAFQIGRQVSALSQKGLSPGPALALQHVLADKLVLSKIRNRFGGRIRIFVSGSAPLSRYMAEFFHATGMLICEGYGLTETSAATFVNLPSHFRFGTVGNPLPGTEVKLAPDGEVLIRGRGVMRGYHRLEEATREVFDEDGFFRSGDIGVIEDGGFLRITDRKKELIKTSGGKYVAPQSVEGKFKAICPYVNQVVVHGNNRNFCVALIALDEESLRKWALEQGLGGASYAELAANPKTRALIEPFVAELNKDLAKHEALKNFALLPADLTQEAGDLTPSLKLKRKAVEAKYQTLLDGFYRETIAGM